MGEQLGNIAACGKTNIALTCPKGQVVFRAATHHLLINGRHGHPNGVENEQETDNQRDHRNVSDGLNSGFQRDSERSYPDNFDHDHDGRLTAASVI
jgi:hypothetical protein